jgi:hypothetical protein
MMLNGKMIDEWGRTWKEVVVASSRYYPGISPEGLRKSENLGQDSQCPSDI